ncbi:MAG: M20 family metallo-hydrolase [Treponema sp.]|jgi:succinyl-diaminopimelate desuccinylase|nr:M20 family metallo-hydrolase [Treponema sp.]
MKDKLFSYIDNAEALAVELETEMCKRPAVAPESGGEGELDKALWLESWLKERGFPFERIDIKDERAKGGVRPNLIVDVHAACSGEYKITSLHSRPEGTHVHAACSGEYKITSLHSRPEGTHVHAACSGVGSGRSEHKSPGVLWIMCHLDVVPPGEMSLWDNDPWTVLRKNDGPLGPRLIGRGVEDNQQGLTSSLIAAMAFKQTGLVPGFQVKLLFCADEECGSTYGMAALLKECPGLFNKDDFVLIPDGGDIRGETIQISEKNLLWLEFSTKGKQAHGSRPDLGANAHLAGAELAVRLHSELDTVFNDRDPLFEPDYSTFQPTKKTSNIPNINTIPGDDYFCMDMRILPRYPIQLVLKEIDRIKAEVETKHKVTISYKAAQQVESQATPEDSPLVSMLSAAVKEIYGTSTRPVGVGGATVGSFLRKKGIHCVVWSRIDDTAHQPNEYTLITNILGDAKVIALLMLGTSKNPV